MLSGRNSHVSCTCTWKGTTAYESSERPNKSDANVNQVGVECSASLLHIAFHAVADGRELVLRTEKRCSQSGV